MSKQREVAATSDGEERPNATADQIRVFVERVECLHGERKELSDDIADVYKEAKGSGVNTKALREVVRLRAKDPAELKTHQDLVELYMSVMR